MSRCDICHRDGLYFVQHVDPDGYVVLACQCPRGERWRTKDQLRALAARLQPAPIWFGRIEEFFTAAELAKLKPVERDHALRDGKEHVALLVGRS